MPQAMQTQEQYPIQQAIGEDAIAGKDWPLWKTPSVYNSHYPPDF
jgi:hypothetical protein